MPRPPKYSSEQILDAVIHVLRRSPVSALSIAMVADVIGAPSGSIYHRFPSRDSLVASAWLRSGEGFHSHLAASLAAPDPRHGALGAAAYTLDWARRRPGEAAFFLLNSRSEVTGSEWPTELARRATRLGNDITDTVRTFARRLPGVSVARARFALLDVPQAAVRRAVSTGSALDAEVQQLVEDTVTSLLAQAEPVTRMAS